MKQRLALLFLTLSTFAGAQSGGSGFTLEQCIAYGLENNVSVKNARLDEEIAKAKVKETVGIGLPQVSGSAVAQQSPTQQRFFTQYDPNSSFSFVDASQIPGIQPGDVVAAKNFFQLKGVGDASVSVNQLIFNGSYIVGLQASNAYKELSVKQANQTKETTVLNISKAFYNLLIAQERLSLMDANLARLDTLYRNTAAMQQSGFVEKIDVDRLKVNINNLKVSKNALVNLVSISENLLKFQMNYPFDQSIEVVGSLQNVALEEVDVTSANQGYESRPDYQLLQTNYKLQQLNIKNKYAEALPTIGAFAKFGMSTQSPTFGGIFKTEASFDEIEDVVGPDKWYGYNSYGIQLSWNLFTGLQRNFQIQQQKLELTKIENNFKMLERSIDLEIEQTQDKLANAVEALEVQSENQQLARSIYDITQTKYQEGVGSSLEVIEADTALKEAQTNYYSALYDAIIAQLDLKKALGILYNQQ